MTTRPIHHLQHLEDTVRSCRRCVAAGHLVHAKPVIWSPRRGVSMVIGQAPGRDAHLRDRPWSGTSGRLMRSWFAVAGFDPERFHDDWYFTSLTKCFPGKAPSGNGDRAPSGRERALCRSHLDTELALIQPPLIITLGRQAAEAMIPGARRETLRQLVGTIRMVDIGYGEVPIVPLPHPSGVARWLNDSDNRALVNQGMRELRTLLADSGAATDESS